MADTNPKPRTSGSSSPLIKIIPIIVILLGIAVAAYFFLHRASAPVPPTAAPTATHPATATATSAAPTPAATAAPPAAPAPELSLDELAKKAGTAFREKRYVSPAGDNAVEAYLQVLDKDPKNQVAQDALREIFPFATGAVEQEINGGNLEESTREIDLLAKADPSNYTLTILRGKLDAKKKQADSAQKQLDLAAAAQAKEAKAKAEAAALAAQQAAAVPPEPVAAPPPPPPKPTPAPVAAPPPPVGVTRPAELVKYVPPDFPPSAYRRKQSGWVEVMFTVNVDGKVADAKVKASEPRHVFDNAALEAARKWTFKPRMQNGQAVEEHVTRRIEFKLGG